VAEFIGMEDDAGIDRISNRMTGIDNNEMHFDAALY
jgi:hypothetical protein